MGSVVLPNSSSRRMSILSQTRLYDIDERDTNFNSEDEAKQRDESFRNSTDMTQDSNTLHEYGICIGVGENQYVCRSTSILNSQKNSNETNRNLARREKSSLPNLIKLSDELFDFEIEPSEERCSIKDSFSCLRTFINSFTKDAIPNISSKSPSFLCNSLALSDLSDNYEVSFKEKVISFFFYNMTPLSDEIYIEDEDDRQKTNLFSNIVPLSDEVYRVDEEFNVSERNDIKNEDKQVKIKFSFPVSVVLSHLSNFFNFTPLSDEVYDLDNETSLNIATLSDEIFDSDDTFLSEDINDFDSEEEKN